MFNEASWGTSIVSMIVKVIPRADKDTGATYVRIHHTVTEHVDAKDKELAENQAGF